MRVLKPASLEKFPSIESLRQALLHDRRTITVNDLGSQAKTGKRRIAQIARDSLSPRRFSVFYHRIIGSARACTIVELGTSLGINTLYLADHPETRVTTFEGAPAIADLAATTFEFAGRKNIDLVRGNIDKTLPAYVSNAARVDFAFLDANHRYEPTLRYFELLIKKIHDKSVVVIDDIYYSPEMARAWKAIRDHQLVYGSADLFRCGIVFFDPSLNKQHVILQV